MIRSIFVSAALLITASAFSQPLIKGHVYIVRHAEKQSGPDPLLTAEGNQRAGDLLHVLEKKNISRIYVTQFKRTQHTADSLMLQQHIDTVQVNADTSCTALLEAISRHNDWNKNILIISHSNIVPAIIYKLGYTSFPQQNLPEQEFDNLYHLYLNKRVLQLEQLKYGKPSASSAPMH